MKIVHLAIFRDKNINVYFLQQNLTDHTKNAKNNYIQEVMKESKGVYVTKHKIRDDQNFVYQLYRSERERCKRDNTSYNFASQYDSKRDNDICTCKNTARKRRHEFKYFSGLPKQIYACQERSWSRGVVDIGVGSVKTIHRRKVKRVYLPETDDTGVGSSDLSSFILRKRYPKVLTVNSFYDHKRTSSKCVGGILEYNSGCAIHQKLSPIVFTKSGATSPKISMIIKKDTDIGSNTIDNKMETIGTQFEVQDTEKKETTYPEKQEYKSIVAVSQNQPKPVIAEQKLQVIVSEQTQKNKYSYKNTEDVKKPEVEKKLKETDRTYSSDSLVQHVHNLENPSDEKHSRTSFPDPMENKLEREYRKMFSTTKSKESKPSCDKPIPEFKSASVLRRRFEALRRGIVKKDESNSNNKESVEIITSNSEIPTHKDASVTSDPPSLVSRSFSNTEKYKAAIEEIKRDNNKNTRKKEKLSSEWQQPASNSANCEGQGVKGMFKLWGKKFNFEEDAYGKRQATPMSSYDKSKKTDKEEQPKVETKENKKESKKFFFFKKKSKEKNKNACIPKKDVTAGRCEINDGIVLKIGDARTSKAKPKISEEGNEITRKAWLRRFLSETMESARSVNIRWNNSLYATSSSTVFELLDSVYKNTNVVLSQSDVTTGDSSYFKSFTKQVNFVQDIEAWMIPRTILDWPVRHIPIKQISPRHINSERDITEKNLEYTTSDQKWHIEKSEAFSHKIEVVLHSNNTTDMSNKKVSSEYLRIDIPRDFFDTSSDESKQNNSSDEEVYKIVEYETNSEIGRARKAMNELHKGDHIPTDIQVIVSVKDSKNLESKLLETVIKRLSAYKEPRDVKVQGNDENETQRCDVIGVGIITQRDLREIRKPILKIRDDITDDESEPVMQLNQKKCEFAESYLQEYYRHWTPFGLELYPWCASDSHVHSNSEKSFASMHNPADGSKSCPNIYEDLEPTIVTSCETSSIPCKHCTYDELTKEKLYSKMMKKFKIPTKAKTESEIVKNLRVLPKDSLEVFKRRKINETNCARAQWAKTCCDAKDVTCSVPSVQIKRCSSSVISSPKVEKPVVTKPKNKCGNKRVSMPGCKSADVSENDQPFDKPIEGILSFKRPVCEKCDPKSKCAKHAVVNPIPSCEIPQPPCKKMCDMMKSPHCNRPNSPSCNTVASCKTSPVGTPICPKPLPSEICQLPPHCVPEQPSCKLPLCPAGLPIFISPLPCSSPPPCKLPPLCKFLPLSKSRQPCKSPPSCNTPPPCKTLPPCKSPPPYKTPPPCKAPPPCEKPPPCKTPPHSKTTPPCKTPVSCKTPPSCLKLPSCMIIPHCRTPPPFKKSSCEKSKHSKKSPPCSSPPPCQSPPPCPSPHPCRSPSPCPSSAPRMKPPPPSLSPPPCESRLACESPSPCKSSPPCPLTPLVETPPPYCKAPCKQIPPCNSSYKTNSPSEKSSILPWQNSTGSCSKKPSPPSCKTTTPSCSKCSPRCSLLPWKRSKSPPYKLPPCNPLKCDAPLCNPAPCKTHPCKTPSGKVPPCEPNPCKPTPCEPPPCKPPQCNESTCSACYNNPSPCKKSSPVASILNWKESQKCCVPECVSASITPKKKLSLHCSKPCCKSSSSSASCTTSSPESPCSAPKKLRSSCDPPKSPQKTPCLVPHCQKLKKPKCGEVWPTNNQVSNPPSPCHSPKLKKPHKCLKNRIEKPEPKCSSLKLSASSSNTSCFPDPACFSEPPCTPKLVDPLKPCPQKPACPTKPCPPKLSCPQKPCLPKPPCPPTSPRNTKSRVSGLFLKIKPAKPKTCTDDCNAGKNSDHDEMEGMIKVCSHENLTIKIKEATPSTEEIRAPFNMKVQDEDGRTLYERKDYTCGNQHRGVLTDLYKESKVNRVTTPLTVTNIVEEHDDKKDLASYVSDKSLINAVEINFKLRITQGDKTTEIDIGNDNDDNRSIRTDLQPSKPEVFIVNGESAETNADSLRNDINIKITLRNFKPKAKHNLSKHKKRTEDFSKKISDKFHTVSTGYSDVEEENVFSIHRATINLASSADVSNVCSKIQDEMADCAASSNSTNVATDATGDDYFEEVYSKKEDQDEIIKDTHTVKSIQPSFNETDTEDATLMELNTSEYNDDSAMSKVASKEHKKELLKKVFQKAGKRSKNKENVRELREMLKIILTDSSDNEETNVSTNDLAKDVTYTSLKPNYFRDTDSMNNYYQIDSNRSSVKVSNIDAIYPTAEANSRTSNSSDTEDNDMTFRGCMCSKVAERLNQANANKIGCCCRQTYKQDEETNCDIRKAADYFLLNYQAAEYVDVETQNSRRLTSNVNSYNVSIHSTSKRKSFATSEDIEVVQEITMIKSPNQTVSRSISQRESLAKQSAIKIKDVVETITMKSLISKNISKNVKKSEIKLLNQNSNTYRYDDQVSRRLTQLSIDRGNKSSKSSQKSDKSLDETDILQSYAAKKAVLEIYAEKTDNSNNYVAKLPKFVMEKESEIAKNFEQIATNSYKSVCKENVIIMSVKR